jgi:TatD DNase family protein
MIDSHCHLDFDTFDKRRDKAVSAANEAGVHTIINIGIDVETSQRSIEIAERFDSIYATVGIHPHDSKKLDNAALNRLASLAKHTKVVGIGEIGLDFYRDLSPRHIQKKAFEQQLELAVETKLPIVIHTRESFQPTVEMVKKYAGRLAGGVFHCFPGDINDARQVIDLGFVISVGGVITFKNSKMSKVAAKVPLDKVILETDAPFLTPEPHRGKKNEPAYVALVYRKLAELRDMPLSEVEKVTDRTCKKLFRLEETFEG